MAELISKNELMDLLRRLRAEAVLTQEQLATRLNVSTSLIAKFETGRLTPMADTAAHMDRVYGTGDEVQRASARVRDRLKPRWFLPWEQAEQRAVTLRSFEASVIPGLLQTEAYARSVLDDGSRSAEEVDEQVSIRLSRQPAVLDREDPPTCTFILDADALRCGPPTVAKEQLQHLVDVGLRPNIFVRVIPGSVRDHPGRSGAFIHATLENGESAGYTEDLFEGRVTVDPVRLGRMDRLWHAVCAVALPCDMSRDLISKLVDEL